MREILFRGKQKGNGKWVFGCYYKQSEFYGSKVDDHIIITSHEDLFYDQALDFSIVRHETVGQFTGLTDKNGKKIFEGDIVRAESILNSDTWAGYVVWWHGCFAIQEVRTKNVPAIDLFRNYEIIGNIHDNPDLLKGSSSYGERKDNDST